MLSAEWRGLRQDQQRRTEATVAGTAFRFRYQQILELKQKQEQAVSVRIASLDRDIRRHEGALRRWALIRDEAMEKLRGFRRKGDLADCDYYADYLNYVRAQLLALQDELADLREQRVRVREELERFMQSRKVFEELRDREKTTFLVHRQKQEQMAIDTHSLARFGRVGGAR